MRFHCRGRERREELVKYYDILPVSHIKLLKGQTKQSAAGGEIVDTYYTFTYAHKFDENDKGVFFCGYYAAEHFLELTNQKPLPVFNPLKVDLLLPNEVVDNNTDESPNTRKPRRVWHPVAKELYIALSIFTQYRDQPLHSDLAKYQMDLMKYYFYEPSFKRINHINNVFGKWGTLQVIIQKLRKDNPNFNDYPFPLIEQILNNKNRKNNF